MNFFRNGSFNAAAAGAGAAAAAHRLSMCEGGGDVPIYFRQPLMPGSSDFEVNVSRMFCRDRCFSFPYLSVVPGYFGEQAAQLGLDTDQELDSETTEYVSCSANRLHLIPDIMERHVFECVQVPPSKLTIDYIKEFNQFFFDHKPAHMTTSPFFLDWFDHRYRDKEMSEFIKIVKTSHMVYYGQQEEMLEFTEGVHDKGLPAGLRGVSDANYMNFPSYPLADELVDQIGVRLHVAPYTKLVATNGNIFEFLGFNSEEIKAKVKTGDHHMRYVIFNDQPFWITIYPERPVPKNMALVIKHEIRMGHSRNDIYSGDKIFQLSERDSRKPAKVMAILKPIFKQISQELNIQYLLDYKIDVSKFQINLPPEISARVLMSPNLQHCLGLGVVNTALTATTESEVRKDDTQEKEKADSLVKAQTLVFDTGTVLCTPAQDVSSSSALSLGENFMASLHPKNSGILETKSYYGMLPNRVAIDDLRFGSDNKVKLGFRLHRYLDNGETIPFGWKVDSYVTGLLLCTPMLSSSSPSSSHVGRRGLHHL
jgi:hypothetical protein